MDDYIQRATKSFQQENDMFLNRAKRMMQGHKFGRKKGCPAWNKGKKKGEKSEFTY